MATPLDMPKHKEVPRAKQVKQTIVIEGSRVGAEFACALALTAGLTDPGYKVRDKDNSAMVWAYTLDQYDKSARARWVKQCKALGIVVKPAPWEKK